MRWFPLNVVPLLRYDTRTLHVLYSKFNGRSNSDREKTTIRFSFSSFASDFGLVHAGFSVRFSVRFLLSDQ